MKAARGKVSNRIGFHGTRCALFAALVSLAGSAATLQADILVQSGGLQGQFHNFAGFAQGLNFYPTVDSETFTQSAYAMAPTSTTATSGSSSATAGINSFAYGIGADSITAYGSTFADVTNGGDAEQTIYFSVTFQVDQAETYYLTGNVGFGDDLSGGAELSLANYDPVSDVFGPNDSYFYTNVTNATFDDPYALAPGNTYTFTGFAYSQLDGGGGSSSTSSSFDFTLAPVSVPEPGSLCMLVLTALPLMARRRRI